MLQYIYIYGQYRPELILKPDVVIKKYDWVESTSENALFFSIYAVYNLKTSYVVDLSKKSYKCDGIYFIDSLDSSYISKFKDFLSSTDFRKYVGKGYLGGSITSLFRLKEIMYYEGYNEFFI